MPTKIVVISDTHNRHDSLLIPEGDILVHCGDFTFRGTEQEIIRFNDFLGTLKHPLKLIVSGNHDFLRVSGHDHVQKLLTNAVYLENNLFEFF